MKNLKRYWHDSWRKLEKKRWSLKQEMRQSNSFSVVNGRLSSQEFGVGAEIKNAKSELYSKVTLWKMIQTVTQYYRGKFICITNDVRKFYECHIKTTGMRRTSSRRSINLYPGQNGRCFFLIEIPRSECPVIWLSLLKHKWSKSWSSMENPIVPLVRNLCGHPSAGLPREKAMRESTTRTRLGQTF